MAESLQPGEKGSRMTFTNLTHINKNTPLVVFSDDWGVHPSSTQHIVRELLNERQVLWVNTIGTRTPNFSISDMKKGFRKIKHWITGGEKDSDNTQHNLRVTNPIMWPSFHSICSRNLNAKIISLQVNRIIEEQFDQPPVALTTIPLTADLIGKINATRWIYHVVDDFSAWPGLDHQPLRIMHREQLDKVDQVAVVSKHLQQQCESFGRKNTTLTTHGVDANFWDKNTNLNTSHPVFNAVQAMRKPIALFWGLIDERLNWDALRELSSKWEGEIALVGPMVDQIKNELPIKALRTPGPIPHDQLPALARLADALIMPYGYSDATAAMQPLKLKEYLSTDKPVICTDISAVQDYRDYCDVVPSHQFADRVIKRYQKRVPPLQLENRKQLVISESWTTKANQISNLINSFNDQTYTEQKAA